MEAIRFFTDGNEALRKATAYLEEQTRTQNKNQHGLTETVLPMLLFRNLCYSFLSDRERCWMSGLCRQHCRAR